MLRSVESSRPQRKTIEADAATIREKYDEDEYLTSVTQISFPEDQIQHNSHPDAPSVYSSGSTLVHASPAYHEPAGGYQCHTEPQQAVPRQSTRIRAPDLVFTVTPRPMNSGQPITAAIHLTPWELTPEKLCEELSAAAQNSRAPAVGVAMVSPKGAFTFIHGVRKHGLPTPVGQNDRFITCLVSSVMVRVVLGRIIDQGLFSWDSKIVDLLPELRAYFNPTHEDTTVAMMAANVSGLTDRAVDVENGQLWSYITGGRVCGHEGRRAVVLSYLTKPPNISPSSNTYRWNQTNALILMFVMETVTGEAYESLLSRELLNPLGLTQTGFGQPDAERNSTSATPVQPWPHYMSEDQHQPVRPVPFNPADRMQVRPTTMWLHSVMADMARVCRFCIDGTDDSGAPLLTPASWKRVFGRYQDTTATCGDLFVSERPWGKGLVYSSCGNDMGFASALWIAPEVGKAFFTVTNVHSDLGSEICDEFAGICARF
jgi:CubicO group peptidase (beta-lactamase class C family)